MFNPDVILTDGEDVEAIRSLMKELSGHNAKRDLEMHVVSQPERTFFFHHSVRMRHWHDTDSLALEQHLATQLIGTRILILATWARLQHFVDILNRAGYAPDEYQTRGYGHKQYPVLCVGCYTINAPSSQERITCTLCARSLVVSNHYSPRLHAVLGYLSVAEAGGSEGS
jgi:hypothetical protein